MDSSLILADGRWSGPHGIGRFSTEVLSRLTNVECFTHGPKPLALKNLYWQNLQLKKLNKKYRLLFTPGFNPILFSPIPYVITIHDLIHLFIPGKHARLKRLFYEIIMKPSLQQAKAIITVSQFSKNKILEWTDLPANKITVVGSGVSSIFKPVGDRYQPGYPYLLHVGNTKPHKNVLRLIQAFSMAKIDNNIKLILTGELTKELTDIIQKNKLQNRIIFSGKLSETQLASYYRGALAIVFPSLYEGFGLPVLEGMACGAPVLSSDLTSIPEIAGDAALLIDPYQIDEIKTGIEKIINDCEIRNDLIAKGLKQVLNFTWENTARNVQEVLNQNI